MRYLIALSTCLATLFTMDTNGQIPKSGTYQYKNAFAEGDTRSGGQPVTVVISGDSIKVFMQDGQSGKNGMLLQSGKIVKHRASGHWIVAEKPEDEFAEKVGSCLEGPKIIDFDNKKWGPC